MRNAAKVLQQIELRPKPDAWILNLALECGGSHSSLSAVEHLAVWHRTAGNGSRSVVFSGDSMVRQLFLRLVFAIRDRQPVIEFHRWFDITYVVYADGDDLQYRVPSRTTQKSDPRLKCDVYNFFTTY